MKHFKNSQNQVIALEDNGSQDFLIAQLGLVSITDEEKTALLTPPPEPYPKAKEELLSFFRDSREQYLNRLAGIGLAALNAGDTTIVNGVLAFRQGLLDLPTHPTILAATDRETLSTAIRTRYNALVAATPTSLKIKFWEVNFVG